MKYNKTKLDFLFIIYITLKYCYNMYKPLIKILNSKDKYKSKF